MSATTAAPRDGERLSFDEFAGARGDRLLELAWLITRHPEDARDAVQDLLTSLYPRWSRLPTGDEFKAYLYRSLVNACLRIIRRRDPVPRAWSSKPPIPFHHNPRLSLESPPSSRPRFARQGTTINFTISTCSGLP